MLVPLRREYMGCLQRALCYLALAPVLSGAQRNRGGVDRVLLLAECRYQEAENDEETTESLHFGYAAKSNAGMKNEC